MSNIEACLSSNRMDWATPPEVVAMAAGILGIDEFVIDVAAREDNKKAKYWMGPGSGIAEDALETDWHSYVWCNPPYGRELSKWVEKAATEAREGRAVVAMLIPARTDTRYFHDHIWDADKGAPRDGIEVHFLKGRIKFIGAKSCAPFPSMLVIFKTNDLD